MKYKWKDVTVNIEILKPAEYNPRKTNKRAKKKFEETQEKYGDIDLVVVNANGNIIGGHQKYYSAVERGETLIEISQCHPEMPIEDERALNIKLNSIGGFTVMDDLVKFGYTKEYLDSLGFREFKMPEIKLDDTPVVEANKEKNKSVLALFFKTEEIIIVRTALKNIIKTEDDVINTSDAIKFLIKNYG